MTVQCPTLFFDLDGVLADFHGGFAQWAGQAHDALPEAELWAHVARHPAFFAHLPELPAGVRAFRQAQVWSARHGWEAPAILTACPAHDAARSAQHKRQWVREHLGPGVPVVTVVGGRTKPQALRTPHDVLFDDWAPNIEAWQLHGGQGVHWQVNTAQWLEAQWNRAPHRVVWNPPLNALLEGRLSACRQG